MAIACPPISEGESSSPKNTDFEFAPLHVRDAEVLFKAQNQLVLEHEALTKPHCSATFDEWKTVLGYPSDDERRRSFIRNMPSGSTKHGRDLHCLKLTQGNNIIGFIEFEVKHIKDELAGNARDIYVRNLVVGAQRRRQGCGHMLYKAMLKFLGLGPLDVIRLSVMDLNQAAVNLYFKLGFKITQWYFRKLSKDGGFRVIFLCMQNMRGERLDSEKPESLPISLRDMPHLFKEEILGEHINIAYTDGSCVGTRYASIKAYDKSSRTFTVLHLPDSGKCKLLRHPAWQPAETSENICVNDLYSCGKLTFEKAPSIMLNDGRVVAFAVPVPQDALKPAQADQSENSCKSTSCPSSPPAKDAHTTPKTDSERKRVRWPSCALSLTFEEAESPPTKCGSGRKRLAWPSCVLVPAKQPRVVQRPIELSPANKVSSPSLSSSDFALQSISRSTRSDDIEEFSLPRSHRVSDVLRRAEMSIFAGGKINVGISVDELGFIVRDTMLNEQIDLQLGEVIVAVGNTSLLRDDFDDPHDEVYKQKARSKLRQSLGKIEGVVGVVVGSLTTLRQRTLPEVRVELDKVMQSISAIAGG